MGELTQNDILERVRDHKPQPIGGWRYYSVLLPLVEKDDGLYVLYELRSRSLDAQPGEVSFPGGTIEENESPGEAARREASEELGLPISAVEIITELDYLIASSNRTIYCFLGKISAGELENAQINSREVEEYFLVPLSWLLENDPKIYVNRIIVEQAEDLPMDKLAPTGKFTSSEKLAPTDRLMQADKPAPAQKYNWKGGKSPVPVYTWPDPKAGKDRYIWGFTARLTMSFVSMISRSS